MKRITMREWIWQQLSLQVPDDWEMLQYSKDPAKGNCAFADRYMFRLELSWKKFDEWPDFERMLDDYQAQLRKTQGLENFQSEMIGAWHGFHAKGKTGESSRFGRYFEATSKLVELVFLWDERIDRSALKDILGTVKLQLPRDDEQRWQAFGMNMHTGQDMCLNACQVQPALASLTFTDNEDRATRQDVFERYGMTDEWLKCDLETWLKTKQPRFVPEVSFAKRSHAHHQLVMASGPAPSMNFPRFSNKRNWYAAAAWICPDDGRLYFVSRIRPFKAERGMLPGSALACCVRLGKEAKI